MLFNTDPIIYIIHVFSEIEYLFQVLHSFYYCVLQYILSHLNGQVSC